MEFREIESKIAKIFLDYLKKNNITHNDDYLVLKISEELGEFIQSYIIHKKKCRSEKCISCEESKKEMAKELADVVGLAFAISKDFDIDLEEALVKKWISREWIKK